MSALAQKQTQPGQTPHQFVVTLYRSATPEGSGHEEAQILWSTIWGGRIPLGLGFPFVWVIEKLQHGVRLRRMGNEPDRLIEDAIKEIGFFELAEGKPIALEGPSSTKGNSLWLDLKPVLNLGQIQAQIAQDGWVPQSIGENFASENATDSLFRKSALVLSLILLFGWVSLRMLPAPKEDPLELIPPQFAKTLLSPVMQAKSGANKTAATGKRGGGVNLVMAFKSETVKRSTKALLNVNSTKELLATSSLLDGAATTNLVRKVFEGKGKMGEKGALSSGIDPQALVPKVSGQVTMMGDQGKGKSGGSADYGKGRGAAILGQGSSQVGISTEEAGVSEGLTKDEVGLVIRKHLDEVRYCYESALVRLPGFEGKLLVSFNIQRTGLVKTAIPKESCGDSKLDACIISRLLKWKFPKPRGGVDVGVSYPFIFKSLGN